MRLRSGRQCIDVLTVMLGSFLKPFTDSRPAYTILSSYLGLGQPFVTDFINSLPSCLRCIRVGIVTHGRYLLIVVTNLKSGTYQFICLNVSKVLNHYGSTLYTK